VLTDRLSAVGIMAGTTGVDLRPLCVQYPAHDDH
jgi:hypothetical protein